MGIVGAGGFIGSALLRRLRASAVEVDTFTRTDPVVSPAGTLPAGAESWRTVYWLASSVNPAVAELRPDLVDADQAQFEGFLAAVRASGLVSRIVLLSSGGTVYDSATDPPYTEDSPVRPVTEYGRSKLRLEAALHALDIADGSTVVLRVSNAYGPGQPARRGQGVVAYWLEAAANREPLVLLGHEGTVRDFVYIDDIVDALVAVDKHGAELPPVVNVGSGRPTTLAELAGTVLEVVGDPQLEFRAEPPRGFDLSRTWLDVSAARDVLGWRPTTELRGGVAEAWADVSRRVREGPSVPTAQLARRRP